MRLPTNEDVKKLRESLPQLPPLQTVVSALKTGSVHILAVVPSTIESIRSNLPTSFNTIPLPDLSGMATYIHGRGDDLLKTIMPAVDRIPNIDLDALRSSLSTEEAKTAAIVLAASGSFLLLVRHTERAAPSTVEMTTVDDLNQLNAGGCLRDLGAWLITPTVTAIRVTGHGTRIPRLPLGVYNLVRLTELSISGNSIHVLPPGISRLSQLKIMDVSFCKLTSLPDDIGALSSLVSLNAMGNQITQLPDSIGGLTSLVRLGLKDNKLKTLPRSIGKLKNLKELFLTDNELESLPDEIGGCESLVKVQASHNSISYLPAALGTLPHLEMLRVACSEIAEIPAAVANAPALAWTSFATNPVCKTPSPRRSGVPTISLSSLDVGRKVGDGASGEVFEASWKGRTVALKLFRADRSPDGHSADEIAIACALSEPHVVKVLAKLDSPLGLLMEFCQGLPLAEKPNSESLLRCRWAPGLSLTLDFVLNVAGGVASALETMHGRGLIHGDVYAHNVLADWEGNAVLCDYGAAFYAPRQLAASFEGQEARAFALFLRDLVMRIDIGFEGMEHVLETQKQLLLMAQQCMSGAPSLRPKMKDVVRRLKSLRKSAASSRTSTPRSGVESYASASSARLGSPMKLRALPNGTAVRAHAPTEQ